MCCLVRKLLWTTGYFPCFLQLSKKFPTDLSLLPHNSGLFSCHRENLPQQISGAMNIQSSLLDAAVCLYFRWLQHADKPACLVSGVKSSSKTHDWCKCSLPWKTATSISALLACNCPMGPKGLLWECGKHKHLLLCWDLVCQVSAQRIYFLMAGLYSPEMLSLWWKCCQTFICSNSSVLNSPVESESLCYLNCQLI